MLKAYDLINIDTGESVYWTVDENRIYNMFYMKNIASLKFDGTLRYFILTCTVSLEEYLRYMKEDTYALRK